MKRNIEFVNKVAPVHLIFLREAAETTHIVQLCGVR